MSSRKKLRDPRLFYRDDSDVIHCRVPGPNGQVHRLSTKCRSEDAARDFADRQERRFASPAFAVASTTTLEIAVNSLLEDMKRRGRSKSTREIAVQKTGHFLRIWGSTLPLIVLAERGGEMVLAYFDKRVGEGVSEYTAKREVQHLRMVLELARFLRTFPGDIDHVIPPNLPGSYTARRRTPSPIEVNALCAELEPDRAAHVCWYVATGGREDESVRACREDVRASEVHIRGTKTQASDDVVPITPITRPWIKRALAGAPGDAPLFRPWGNYLRDMKAACKRAGIEPVTPNDLRRAFARWHREALVQSGHSGKSAAEVVSRLLRHTTDKLVQQTYAVLEASIAGDAFDRFGESEKNRVENVTGGHPETVHGAANETDEQAEFAGNEERDTGLEPVNLRLGKPAISDDDVLEKKPIGVSPKHTVSNMYESRALAAIRAALASAHGMREPNVFAFAAEAVS